MVHVLEHIPNPINILNSLKRLLRPNGMILIQVPDWTENPFILLVGVHCSHFDLNSLRFVIRKSGLGLRILENQIVKKEITALCSVQTSSALNTQLYSSNFPLPSNALDWLSLFLIASKNSIKKNEKVGIFGSSLAASWLASELNYSNNFFVDEDPSRINKTFFDRPIVSISEIPNGSRLIVPLPDPLLSIICNKIQGQAPSTRILKPKNPYLAR